MYGIYSLIGRYSTLILFGGTVYFLVQCHHFSKGYGFIKIIYERIKEIKGGISESKRNEYSGYAMIFVSCSLLKLMPECFYFLLLASICYLIYLITAEMESLSDYKVSLLSHVVLMIMLNGTFVYTHMYTVAHLSEKNYFIVYIGMFALQALNILSVIKYVEISSRIGKQILVTLAGVLISIVLMSLSNYLIIGIVKVFICKPEDILINSDVEDLFTWLSFVMYGIEKSSKIFININEPYKMSESLFAYALSFFNMGVSGAIMISFFVNNIFKRVKCK